MTKAATMTLKPENKSRVDRVLNERLSNPLHDHNGRHREEGKSFTDAMNDVSIASGKNGRDVLEAIKKAGR